MDSFSGWPEGFPAKKKKTANIMAKNLLEEIIPKYGLPMLLGSDNGPAFISQITQSLGKIMGTDWKLHCAYHLQNSGQAKRMNWI